MENGLSNFLSFPPNSLQKELSIISEKSSLEASLESTRFKKFLDYVKESHPKIEPQDNHKIRSGIKLKIPPLTKIEDLKNLYQKSFLLKKTLRIKRKRLAGKKEKWKMDQIIVFVWVVSEYSYIQQISIEKFTEEDWKYIASLFPLEFSAEKCRYKWNSMQKCSYQKEDWTSEEDQVLKGLVRKNEMFFKNRKSYKWTKIAQELNDIKQSNNNLRLGKHCRERWLNHLDPKINREDWSFEEDLFLLESIREIGKKWALISTWIEGRNENAVKNRFTSLVRTLGRLKTNLNTENMNDVIQCFKEKNAEIGSPIKKQKLIKNNEVSFEKEKKSTLIFIKKSEESYHIPLDLATPTLHDKKENMGQDSPRKTIKFYDEVFAANCSPIFPDKQQLYISNDDFPMIMSDKKIKNNDMGSPSRRITFADEFKEKTPNNFQTLTLETNNIKSDSISIEESPFIIEKKEKTLKLDITQKFKAHKSNDILSFKRESSANFQRRNDKKSSWFSTQDSPLIFDKSSGKALLYDIALYCLPNVYSKKYSPDDDLFKISDEKKREIYKMMIHENLSPEEFDDLSQKISSMSLSDQMLLETNKILTEISSKLSEKGKFFDSIAGSDYIEKSEGKESEEKKEQILVSKVINNDDGSQIDFEDPLNRHLLRCRTQNEFCLNYIYPIEEKNEDVKLSPNLEPTRKKKSATVIQQALVLHSEL